eukprot:bmy_13995T0
MPKVKRSRKAPPDGWELIEPTLDELDQKMREAETEPHEGKRKVESLWPIFRIHHQKTRYIFDLFYKRKAISRELYEYCIKEGYADKNLIAKWKKQGYENLCCLRCIQTRDTNFGTNCICRVPKSKLEVMSRGHPSRRRSPACGRVTRGRGAGSQLSSVCRAGSSSARTAAAGAALAEAVGPTPLRPGLWTARVSACHATLSWEQLLLRAVPQARVGTWSLRVKALVFISCDL